MMGPIELVVFDIAGTTVEDNGAVLACLIDTVYRHNLPGEPKELNHLMGMNKREVFAMLAARRYPGDYAFAERVADEALTTFIAQMKVAYEKQLSPMPGAEATFAFLRERGIKIATDTGFDATIGGLIMDRLNWLGRFVDLAVFSTDVSLGRPAPYMIYRAMEQLGVFDVHKVMKLGDSPADLEEGYNAGCGEVIGVLSGAHTAETLGSYWHTRLIKSVAELPALFR
ncbi:MAG: phosphonatase-like hydrolase [Ktedonobacteraceae bacterium]